MSESFDAESVLGSTETLHRAAIGAVIAHTTLEVLMSEITNENGRALAAARRQLEQTTALREKVAALVEAAAENRALIDNLQAESLQAISAKQAAVAHAESLQAQLDKVAGVLDSDDHLDAPAPGDDAPPADGDVEVPPADVDGEGTLPDGPVVDDPAPVDPVDPAPADPVTDPAPAAPADPAAPEGGVVEGVPAAPADGSTPEGSA